MQTLFLHLQRQRFLGQKQSMVVVTVQPSAQATMPDYLVLRVIHVVDMQGDPTAPSRTELQGPCELQVKYAAQGAFVCGALSMTYLYTVKAKSQSTCLTRVTHRLDMQDKYTLQAARHPEALMALLAVATRGGRCDIVVIDGMCFDLLRFRDGKRYLVYNNLKGEQVCANLSMPP